MVALAVLSLLLALSPGPLEVVLQPGAEETFAATLVGPATGSRGGRFEGSLSLNGSPAELPIKGNAEVAAGRLRIPLTLRYADVPADWANRYRPEGFDYRVRGRLDGGESVEWAGRGAWEEVAVEGDRRTASRVLRLSSLEVTDLSFTESRGRAVLAVRNPFTFPVRIAAVRYRLLANERAIGSGETRGLLLRPSRENTLLLPVELDHAGLVAAAGSALVSGGSIDTRLRGALTLRLPGGDVEVPLDLAGRLSL
jgi:hypothetical protein